MSDSFISGCSFLAAATALALAPKRATSVDSLAVPWITPPAIADNLFSLMIVQVINKSNLPFPPEHARNDSGSPRALPNQSNITTSNSVHAGLAI